MPRDRITWILEREAFADGNERLAQAARSVGHNVIDWDDDWWSNARWPSLSEIAIFHGSLGNAARIRKKLPWKPGAYCATECFFCSEWYESARRWILHEHWVFCSAQAFVENPLPFLERIGCRNEFFVRPDSPLKPFSGRVLDVSTLSLEALDYGFYYDDPTIPIVMTPVKDIGSEWRLVVAHGVPVSGCEYVAREREEASPNCPQNVWEFATAVARSLASPDPVYVMDVCQSGDELKLLELNPFSGADLYACDRIAIVRAIGT